MSNYITNRRVQLQQEITLAQGLLQQNVKHLSLNFASDTVKGLAPTAVRKALDSPRKVLVFTEQILPLFLPKKNILRKLLGYIKNGFRLYYTIQSFRSK